MRKTSLGTGALGALLLALSCIAPAQAWDRGDVDTFAVVPKLSTGETSVVEGLTVGPDGNIYVPSFGFNAQGSVAAGDHSEIFVFTPHGHLLRHLVVQNSSPHALGLAFSPALPFVRGVKSLILCDFGGGKILQVDPFTGDSAVFMTPNAANPAPGFNSLTFDRQGNAYISDSFQSIIWKTPPHGTGNAPGQVWLQDPLLSQGTGLTPPFGANGIEFNNAGDILYVANTAFHQIIQIPVAGGVAGKAAVLITGINAPDGFAVDRLDNLWIAANQEDEIVVVDPNARSDVAGVSTVVPKVIAKLGDFDGVTRDGTPRGLLFPASPAFSLDGRSLYVTNLALYLPFAGALPAIDSPWTLKVEHPTVGRIDAVIPRHRREDDKQP
ncbi:MAG TPA: SMP-30/gluconolactonase/LRE family protein [Aliidongia sp.]|nr:SMP-30/gluconolactonase/LRE family protein [Aliidongia sp.]